jgi:hypothetical protein
MLQNPHNLWYTDLLTVYRGVDGTDGSVDVRGYGMVCADIPCRVYQPSARGLKMTPGTPEYAPEDKLACGVGVDIQAGDRLMVTRGGGLDGGGAAAAEYFAGNPVLYFEPFGGAIPGLAHQEITLSGAKRAKARIG